MNLNAPGPASIRRAGRPGRPIPTGKPPAPAASPIRCVVLLASLLAGCRPAVEGDPPPPPLHPVSGVVTLDGEPLVGAVLTFLNVDERGTPSLGETDETGTYRLRYLGGEGAGAGPYRVAVSQLISTEGKALGIAERSTTAPTAEFATAKEQLPPRYSKLGKTILKAEVPPGGGKIDFALETEAEAAEPPKSAP